MSDFQLAHILFEKPPHLRLTFVGYQEYRRYVKPHEFVDTSINSRQKISLWRNYEHPYYMGNTRIVLFNGEDAFTARLSGIEQLLNNI